MAEYIDRGKLVEFLKRVRRDLPHDSKDFFTRDEMILNFQQFVESKSFVPSEDVEPVRSGHWIKESEHILLVDGTYKEWDNFYCSECDAPENAPRKFCAECGAKMEEYKSDIT